MSVAAAREASRRRKLRDEEGFAVSVRRSRRAGATLAPVGANNRLSFGGDRLLGTPQNIRRELVFASAFSITSTTGAYNETTFTLNSCYHVDGATNSTGFTKYMAFYQKCFVLRSRYRLSMTSGNVNPCLIGGVVTTNASSLGSAVAAIENGLCKWNSMYSFPDTRVFTGSVDHAKFLDKPVYLDDPQLFCTTGAAPSQIIVLHVFDQGGGSLTNTAYCWIEIVQDVVFTDPIPFT